jgi:hypothetical protein
MQLVSAVKRGHVGNSQANEDLQLLTQTSPRLQSIQNMPTQLVELAGEMARTGGTGSREGVTVVMLARSADSAIHLARYRDWNRATFSIALPPTSRAQR